MKNCPEVFLVLFVLGVVPVGLSQRLWSVALGAACSYNEKFLPHRVYECSPTALTKQGRWDKQVGREWGGGDNNMSMFLCRRRVQTVLLTTCLADIERQVLTPFLRSCRVVIMVLNDTKAPKIGFDTIFIKKKRKPCSWLPRSNEACFHGVKVTVPWVFHINY